MIINEEILSLLPGKSTTYLSSDSDTPLANDTGEAEILYLAEYLNPFENKDKVVEVIIHFRL